MARQQNENRKIARILNANKPKLIQILKLVAGNRKKIQAKLKPNSSWPNVNFEWAMLGLLVHKILMPFLKIKLEANNFKLKLSKPVSNWLLPWRCCFLSNAQYPLTHRHNQTSIVCSIHIRTGKNGELNKEMKWSKNE